MSAFVLVDMQQYISSKSSVFKEPSVRYRNTEPTNELGIISIFYLLMLIFARTYYWCLNRACLFSFFLTLDLVAMISVVVFLN